jgi:glyoxylase-like metal-dependent hydrolase (beta-lactamase superfamily II)
MRKPAITLEVLPAGFGDSILVTCPIGRRHWRLLMDCGPDENYPAIRRRLMRITKNSRGKRRIDLLVISHIDHDHIGSIGLLLNDDSLALDIGDVWFNAPPVRRTRGVAEGQRFADLLGAPLSKPSWNAAFSGKHVVTPGRGQLVEVGGAPQPKITLLSPTPDELTDLFQKWAKELAKLEAKERQTVRAMRGATTVYPEQLESLAAASTRTDQAPANASRPAPS